MGDVGDVERGKNEGRTCLARLGSMHCLHLHRPSVDAVASESEVDMGG